MILGPSPLAMANFIIQGTCVEGLQHTEPSTMLNYLLVKVGGNFSDACSKEITRNLYATGFFDDMCAETMGNQVLLTVVKHPTVATLNITGAKVLQDDTIKKNLEPLGLAQSRYFNQAALNQAVAALRNGYVGRGKQLAKITPTVKKLARGRVSIGIAIDEDKSTEITDIEFEGSHVYSGRKLMKQISLSKDGMRAWLTQSNQFNERKFSQDLECANEFYQNSGYFDFRIMDTDAQTNEDKTKQTIKITVDEGERYRWGRVIIDGDTHEVLKEELYKTLTMKEGEWYERQKMMKSLKAMQNRMGGTGYMFSEVNVQPVPSPQTRTMDFMLHVEPGRKVYVNQINVTSNNKIRDEVVRCELRQMEAVPYDTSKLQRSKERVELLGYFNNVQLDARPVEGLSDQMGASMSAQERPTGSLDLSVDRMQDTGMVLSVSVSQDSLFGTGRSASAHVSRSKTTVDGSLLFTDPYFTPDGVNLGYNTYGKSYDSRKASSSAKQYKTTTAGTGIRVGILVTKYDRMNFDLAVECPTVNTYTGVLRHYRDFISHYGEGSDSVGSFKGWLYRGAIGWGRSKTDDALWPTQGYQIGIDGEVALPGSDLEYYALTHSQTWSFLLNKSLTLMLDGKVSYDNGYDKIKEMSFFENFYGGGLGSVCGLESGTLGPKMYDEYDKKISYGGNEKANIPAELLFSMPGIEDARAVRPGLFADTDSVWDGKTYTDKDNDEYCNGRVKRNVYGLGAGHKSTFKEELCVSVGAAVIWLLLLDPTRFNYAYPFKKKESDEVQCFQFQLGTTF